MPANKVQLDRVIGAYKKFTEKGKATTTQTKEPTQGEQEKAASGQTTTKP